MTHNSSKSRAPFESGQMGYTGGIPIKTDGEAGPGIYAYKSGSPSMRKYYTANGEKVVSIRPKESAKIADLTTLDARKGIVEVARRISPNGNGQTTATLSNVQRHPWAVRTYLHENAADADAYLLPHKGYGVPTGKQLVIVNEEAFDFAADAVRPNDVFRAPSGEASPAMARTALFQAGETNLEKATIAPTVIDEIESQRLGDSQ